jgi:hypothetical protein
MRWLRRLLRPDPEPIPEVELVEDKVPCPFGSHFHDTDEAWHEHAVNDAGHWSNERTAAYPVNRPMTPGQQWRSRGGWWRATG